MAAAFEFRGGQLWCDDVRMADVAAQHGTPTYVYSERALLAQYDRLAAAFAPLNPTLCYAVKSCHNLHILRLMGEHGASFDVVSGGELRRVIEAGADPARVVFAGVGKTDAEIATAIEHGVGCFNVESAAELEVLADLAGRSQCHVQAALRVNPDVDAVTHPYTTTGKHENKFGVDIAQAREVFQRFRNHAHLDLNGLHLHIGSPVNTVGPYVEAVQGALGLADNLAGDGIRIELLNLGGGWPASYRHDEVPPIEDYAAAIVPLLEGRGLRVHLEPGRSITANSGVLLSRVIFVKQGRERRFVIADAAITDLLRPALYSAYHFIWPVCPGEGLVPPHHGEGLHLPGTEVVDVVGPVCESGDFLAKGRSLPPVQRGDLLAVFSAGAYGAVMSSQYNSRCRAAEVLIDGPDVRLIRRRETYDDLVAAERDVFPNGTSSNG